ncbi:DNA mismatch repair protein MutS [Candidatus Contubernalis alkaliaceticus]|uniref:DNA mismatch repair protein MutS n=1 Tax=Candidatus Contubernalis alkaliaceticus TaxID=338645 RepID=UPI001F4C325E|nr:DNA mismatch repair protein MutS [Candidatus Contubernalis alkalaceticus]UNC91896.1 DNA mismatch repair protein MutS [Candidatus Contubernalis alkalaceticus]
MAKETPMIKQYWEIKNKHQDKLLFFRVGDFYEMFFEDAKAAARELEIVLTSRDNNVPLAGVPYHAVNSYIARLIEKGYKVALCDQVEDARLAKGLVKREVTRVITPGTVLDENLLQGSQNNYLCGLYISEEGIGLSALDVSTGEFLAVQFTGEDRFAKLQEELMKFNPAECVFNASAAENPHLTKVLDRISGALRTPFRDYCFSPEKIKETFSALFNILSLESLGCTDFPLAAGAAAAVTAYLKELHIGSLSHINRLKFYQPKNYMMIDGVTRRNLELTQTIRTSKKSGSLLGVLDHTLTSNGGRLLRKWILEPLNEKNQIELRLQGVQEFMDTPFIREDCQRVLDNVYDLERIMGRINFGSAHARDLIQLKKTLKEFPFIKDLLHQLQSSIYKELKEKFNTLEELYSLIEECLVDNPPVSIKEGGLIKDGYDLELDEIRKISRQGKNWILELEKEERERTGIKTLKIGFNKVFGYYIDISKSRLNNIPEDYIRKQTLVNSERFITPRLKELEEKILGADEKIEAREYYLFEQVRSAAAKKTPQIQRSARVIAVLDCLLSLARAAIQNHYCRPSINQENRVVIREGRHPVVEKCLLDQQFVPNDTILDEEEYRILIITGPNMAGKSTYMRQVALICLMAQMGSFVPAQSAELCPVDRIFARVGAADDLAGGQSTFMVEMNELANILNNATPQSLVVLDEIGRGTSTFDGMSIAWAVVEYLHDMRSSGAKTLFATHYHELTDLEESLPAVKNYSIAVKEEGEDIVFLRKVIPQKADRSYGIQVARLAGLPTELITRAADILSELEHEKHKNFSTVLCETERTTSEVFGDCNLRKGLKVGVNSWGVMEEHRTTITDTLLKIKSADPLRTTPMEALNVLHEIYEILKRLDIDLEEEL